MQLTASGMTRTVLLSVAAIEGKMRKAILIMLLAVVSSSAAADWAVVLVDDDATFYADPATIRKARNVVKMWTLVDFKAAQQDSAPAAPYLSSLDQSEYDCKEERSRLLYLSNRTGNMGTGKASFTSNTATDWRPIVPGSITNSLWKIACGKR